ncbi:MAG: hypothetical protein IT209_03100, partial [Armatimonadetes bacterium]|nr:hypothetical protein [Armatimonadota bacterium]
RLALQAVMMASSDLEAALRTGEDRPVTRAALETLKISGVLPGCLEATRDSADSLADVIARVKAEMDEHG